MARKGNAAYQHAKYAPVPEDILRDKYAAFVVSFDSKDDDNGDGEPDIRRVPEWVAQEIRRFKGDCVDTVRRPSKWKTDDELYASGVAANDATYAGSGFDRGHMAAKLLAARIGPHADRETHTVLNAVPQMSRFNQQVWRDLEGYTGAWAQEYGKVWVIQGPVFYDKTMPGNARWIGDAGKGERRVAVPDALFKVVVREGGEEAGLHALAFIYPQLAARYYGNRADFAHERFLVAISEIEALTGLSFLKLKSLRTKRAAKLWPVDGARFLTGCARSE